ncbi:MAG: hypothetical protein JO352_17355 [Chloroflexi bacterium]|nr:hypothetical protein [Chloroflexota bacterium]
MDENPAQVREAQHVSSRPFHRGLMFDWWTSAADPLRRFEGLPQHIAIGPGGWPICVAYPPPMPNPNVPPALQIVATEVSPTRVRVGDTIDIKITVRNTSDRRLQSEGPAYPQPGYTYVKGRSHSPQPLDTVSDKWWVGITMLGLDCADLS